MFFCDFVGDPGDPAVADAVAGLRTHCEAVRVLGSFPSAVAVLSGQVGDAARAPRHVTLRAGR